LSLSLPAWHLDRDLVVFEGLRLRVHRIALAHWSAAATLRSWGAATLHREGDVLHVPCADGEALWIGVWLDDELPAASVRVTAPASGYLAAIQVPEKFQIASLKGPDGSDRPIARPVASDRLDLVLDLQCGPLGVPIALSLRTPEAWATCSGRPAPDALTGPPPLPPRLG
jgi:hypothetical protein